MGLQQTNNKRELTNSQKCLLALFVQRFFRCSTKLCQINANQNALTNASIALPLRCYGTPLAQTLISHLATEEQQSAVFVDAATWLRWHFCIGQPYQLSFFTTPNHCSNENNAFARICFVRPLPFALPNFQFAILSPFMAFNLFGISSVGSELINAFLTKSIPIEGIKFAATIRVKLIDKNCNKVPFECSDDPEQDCFMMEISLMSHQLQQMFSFIKSLNGRANLPSCCSTAAVDDGCRHVQFVQRGLTRCTEDKPSFCSSSNNPFPGRFPHQPNMARHLFLPLAIRELVCKLAKILWPLFANGNECKINPLILLQSNFEASKLTIESLCCQLDVRLVVIDCFEFLLNEMEGKNGEKMTKKFDEVQEFMPCVCWVRNLEVIFPGETTTQRQDVLNALIRCLNELKSASAHRWPSVFFLNISPLFNASEVPERLANAFHWEFRLEEGDERMGPEERAEYADWALKNGPMEWADVQLVDKIVEITKGFSLFQLIKLIDDAECVAIGEQPLHSFALDNLPRLGICHFELALKRWTSSSGRNDDCSKVDMDDIGGLDEAKQLLSEALGELVKENNNTQFANRLKRRTGILLHGPPGCGKTMLAKAVANQAGLSFVSVKGPELLSQFVGESERNMREVFAKAKRSAPSVLFFDELDSLAPARGGNSDSGGVMDRMVSQLLTELDSCHWSRNKAVFIMGATNRPDLLDPCLLTPGRFDKLVPINPAIGMNAKERILCSLCKKNKFADGLSIKQIAQKCPETMSGAELAGLVAAASMNRLLELVEKAELEGKSDSEMASNAPQFALSERHFDKALLEMHNWLSPSK